MNPSLLLFIIANIFTAFILIYYDHPFFYAFMLSLGIIYPIFFCTIKDSNFGLLKIDIFQPSIPFVAVYYWFFVKPFIIGDLKYNYILYTESFIVFVYCFISLVIFSIGYNIKLNHKAAPVRKILNIPKIDVFKNKLILALFLISILFIIFWFSVIREFDLNNILKYLSHAERGAAQGVNIWFNILVNFFHCTFFLYIFSLIAKDKDLGKLQFINLMKIIFLMLVGITVSYLMEAKRTSVLPYFLFPIMWFHYLIRPIKSIFKIAVLLIILFAVIYGFLALRIAGMYKAHVGYFGLTQETELGNFIMNPDLSALQSYKLYLDQKDFIDKSLYQANDRRSLIYRYNIEHIFLSIIPRFVWPSKPAYTEHPGQVFYQSLFNAEATTSLAITIFLTPFILFGKFFGSIFFFIFGIFSKYIYDYSQESNWTNKLFYPLIFWLIFEFIYVAIFGPIWTYGIRQYLPFLLMYFLIKRKTKQNV